MPQLICLCALAKYIKKPPQALNKTWGGKIHNDGFWLFFVNTAPRAFIGIYGFGITKVFNASTA